MPRIFPSFLLGAVFLVLGATPPVRAQGAADPAEQNKVSRAIDDASPDFLSVSGEFRYRFEGRNGLGYRAGSDDAYHLVRTRVNIGIEPTSWLRFGFQGQDSRAPGIRGGLPNIGAFRDGFDVRQAYVQFGGDKAPVRLTAGRQLLPMGDERLLGAANWSNTSLTFDAIKLEIESDRAKVDVFSASLVQNNPARRINQSQEGNNLHGIYGSVTDIIPGSTLEPYVLWRTTPLVVNELGMRGDMDRFTGGARLWGEDLGPWDYNAALVTQWGDSAGATIGAWGYYAILGYTFDARLEPRLYTEYTFGSGDTDPNDGKVGGFVDLYPSVHRWYGYNDLVGWRNIKNLRLGLQLSPHDKFALRLDYQAYWLADRNDGLYGIRGRLMVAAPAGGAADLKVGDELNLAFSSPLSSSLNLSGGVGYMFPGPFVKAHTPGDGNTFSYFAFLYSF